MHFYEKNLNDLFYLIWLCFIFFLNLEILIVRYSVFGSKRLTTDSVALFFSLRSAPHNGSEAFRCWRGSRGRFRTVPD